MHPVIGGVHLEIVRVQGHADHVPHRAAVIHGKHRKGHRGPSINVSGEVPITFICSRT
jgi:hypothetical protein